MRRFVLPLALAAMLLLTVAAPASAETVHGGASAVQDGYTDTGGARYSTLPPKPVEKRAKKKKPAVKRKKRRKAPAPAPAPVPAPAPTPSSDHVFPVLGPFSFGGKDSRFGAGRRGHTHQGQDLSAAEGTPLVAPWSSTVEVVKYQAGGAGYYVVLDGNDEDRDYVFMHLRKGSTLVEVGDAVSKGEKFAEVGNTGSSSGAHLHFEIWIGGGWYTGGHPVDPLPFLTAWR